MIKMPGIDIDVGMLRADARRGYYRDEAGQGGDSKKKHTSNPTAGTH
jgi:hypothetical protein